MIKLKNIRLINWYAFNSVTFPVGFFTLVAGKNGNGKSVLLDAVRYALYGDTVFNKSTDNKGSRTIPSYTRGMLDATAGTLMRPAERMPNVYTHIVLEMEDTELQRSFLLGTVIHTDSSNGFRTLRYVADDVSIDEMDHTFEKDGLTFAYSPSELQKLYSLKMMDVREGLVRFMQRTGLRLSEQQLASFRRKLRSIMSYSPGDKVDEFIRRSVLEEKDVDFSKLIEAKNNIDRLNSAFSHIDSEIKDLENIISIFEKADGLRRSLQEDDIKAAYKYYLDCRSSLAEISENMEIFEKQVAEDERKLALLSERKKELEKSLRSAEESLASMDCARAITDAEEALKKTEKRLAELKTEKNQLAAFQEKVNSFVKWLSDEIRPAGQKNILSALTSDSITAAEKEKSVESFKNEAGALRDELIQRVTRLEDAVRQNHREEDKCQKTIDECNARKTTFSEIPDYVKLKDQINREFHKRGIQSEARFACEYVLEIKDEEWRDSLEGYLGSKRYTILTDPEYYDIADDVFNASGNRKAHLFNTKLLMKKKDIVRKEDSVVNFIEVKNPVAARYFDYQLGRIHAAGLDEVRNYENALSKEGKLAKSMDNSFIDFSSIRFYCLGQESIELNRIKAEKRLAALKKENFELVGKLETEKKRKEYIEKAIKSFGKYNYNAFSEYSAAETECTARKTELKTLKEAQSSNEEYLKLAERVEKLRAEHENVEKENEKVREDRANMNSNLERNRSDRGKFENYLVNAESRLRELEASAGTIYVKAIEEFEIYLANGGKGNGGLLKERAETEELLRQTENSLTAAQSSYNALKPESERLPISDRSAAEYQNRKSRIWIDNRQEIQAELKEQTSRYEEIFKNEFVLTVLKSCENARDDIRLINNELKRLEFKARYAFDVKYVKDGSDYEKILEYARYLKEREELGAGAGQVTLDAVTEYSNEAGEKLEAEIKKIIARIVESDNPEKIHHFADYRNYMTYEILMTNDILSKARLSKQSGYNSGAEVQIPYMLILLSALLMIYNDRLNSTRLVFIDEPFAKMDPANVKIMMNFMRDQNLQMFFCAPDKTELIGGECDVVLPVLRVKPDVMEIGIVDMREKTVR